MTQPGRKLFAERDQFGRWVHLLGPNHVRLAYLVPSGRLGMIRRLEVQTHLGDESEDDLCRPEDFPARWKRLETFMAMVGVLPPEEPGYVRVDPAVDVVYDDPGEGRDVLEALRYARWPRGRYAEYQGAPPYTTVAMKSKRKTVARVYCRNTKLRNGGLRWGKLRFEREQRLAWQERRPLTDLGFNLTASTYWGSVFGLGAASGKVTRIAREAQTVKLVERVQSGRITTRQFEQLSAFLDTKRLGLTDRAYNAETARRRRTLARKLGVALAGVEVDALDTSLDDLLAVPRSAWAG